jgi:hypothetical protein
MSAITPNKPPAVAVRNAFELAADYGIQFGGMDRNEKERRK